MKMPWGFAASMAGLSGFWLDPAPGWSQGWDLF